MHKQQSGFTLIELIVVMVIVGLLGAVAVPKFLDVTKKAEAASVKNILGSVRSALSLKVASGLVNGNDISEWAYNGGTNALDPMDDLLAEQPESYVGLQKTSITNDKGSWWDRNLSAADHWLMYRLKNASIITGGWQASNPHIINRITVVRENGTSGDVVGLSLDPTTNYTYTWNE